jgi:outer membrane receptor protein involved in Fe transport
MEPNIPSNSLLLKLSYEYLIVKKINIFAKLNYQRISGLWVDDANSDQTDEHNLLDGLVGVDMKFGKFNLMLTGGINNIFNAVYTGYVTSNSADKRFYNAGAPTNYYLSLILGYIF